MARVLIFDDDTDITDLCTVILSSAGHTVSAEAHTKDILALINQVNPDVILMDNWIPGMGGVKATQFIKNTPALQHIAVIIFSANKDIKAIATEAGADFFLEKPFDIAALNAIVAKAAAES